MMLRDAVTHAVNAEREAKRKSTAGTSNARVILLMMAMIPLLALSAYSWIARPAWIWGPPVRPLSSVEQEANLRMAMYLLGMRIDAYREQTGAYPSSLPALGETIPGVVYTQLTDSTFQLRGVAAGQEIVFQSDGSGKEFLGNTLDVIQTRRTR